MATLTITLPDEKAVALSRKAAEKGTTAERLVEAAVERMLEPMPTPASVPQPPTFEQALKRVLREDEELHRRLAQ
jgi:hypothetical protein